MRSSWIAAAFTRRRGGVAQLVCALLCVAVVLATTSVHALRYHFVDGKPLCFAEVIEDVTSRQITGVYNWKSSATSPASRVQLRITARDAADNEYYNKEMMEGEHSFAVLLGPKVVPGEQRICFTAAPSFITSEEKAVRVTIELDQELKNDFDPEKVIAETLKKRRQVDGLDVFTYQDAGGQLKDNLQPREYLEKIERALGAMERLLDELVAELSTSVQKESRMRETSESTFTRVWVCAVLLISVISGVLWMQFRFLKSTLRKKKLV
ncbi:transmembrane emp24 domain-containing protein [Novymonas esmeraldas]|uniref:Transmembrane emp24 domain-containing protein n=1 Tax=Novymonas esmeraldas TaxID=1808958 RepID=A0AAW0F432_9TRYP